MEASHQRVSANGPILEPIVRERTSSSPPAVSVEHQGHQYEKVPPNADKVEIARIVLTWKEHAAHLGNELKQQEALHSSLANRLSLRKEFTPPEMAKNFFKFEEKITELKENIGKLNQAIHNHSNGLTPEDFKAGQEKKEAELAKKFVVYENLGKGVSSQKIQEKIASLEKQLQTIAAKQEEQQKKIAKLKEQSSAASPRSVQAVADAEQELKLMRAEKKGIEQTIVLYQDDKTKVSNEEFKTQAYFGVKKGLNNKDLLFGAASFKSLSNLFSDLAKDHLNRQESLNVLNFTNDYLTKGFDLPADAGSKAKLKGDLLNLCQSLEKEAVIDGVRDYTLSEKLNQVKSAISQKLDSPAPAQLMNQGRVALDNLKGPPAKVKPGSIEGALKFLENSQGVDHPEVKEVRNSVSAKLQELSKSYSFTNLSAKELAEDVCGFFENEFKQIAGNELNDNNWTRPETREKLSPHLSNLIKGSNEIKANLTESILKAYAENPDKGLKLFNKCLDAAGIALENKNFQAFEILKAAISTPALNRLHLDDKLSSSRKKMYERFTGVDLIRKEIPAMEKQLASEGKTYVPLFVLRMGQLAMGIEGNSMHAARLEVLSKIKSNVKQEQAALRAKPISVNGNPLLRAQLAFTQERPLDAVDSYLEGLSYKVKPPRSQQV